MTDCREPDHHMVTVAYGRVIDNIFDEAFFITQDDVKTAGPHSISNPGFLGDMLCEPTLIKTVRK